MQRHEKSKHGVVGTKIERAMAKIKNIQKFREEFNKDLHEFIKLKLNLLHLN